MNTDFDKWWNEDDMSSDNPFSEGTPAYWAWEGWCAGVKAEREACAKWLEDEKDAPYWAELLRARSNT